ncbi:prostate stem cell antigen [Pygocentrus nattereri]|uniref:prostate stem cell antigen n=1 Tax=Pygocentrus nattereri TaxID=42514 RepID=UPI00081496D4|nr:prostate stem cell antigen [Pygocentrus nattereri]
MKLLVTLVLFYILLSDAFQTTAAMMCHSCVKPKECVKECDPAEDRCYTASVMSLGLSGKGCTTSLVCKAAEATGKVKCCEGDLCNGAEGVKLSLLIMLVPLLFSILFI